MYEEIFKHRFPGRHAVLDIGCGRRKIPGALGIDRDSSSDADIVHDLNCFPYPFEDSFFDFINIDNVLEHLEDVVRVMEEVHRIGRPGSVVRIVVPYFRSKWAYTDPTHRHFFTSSSFNYFEPGNPYHERYHYSNVHFRIRKIIYDEHITGGVFHFLVKNTLAKKHDFFDSWGSMFFPMNTITFYLETLKEYSRTMQ